VAAIEVIAHQGAELRVLPSTSAVLGFQLRGRVRAGEALLATAGITGIQTTARTYSYEPSTTSVLVRFTATGAACLGVPARDLARRSVALEALLPRTRVLEVQERLAEARNAADCVLIVEELLSELPALGDALVMRAIPLLTAPASPTAVRDVASAFGISERQLERRFLTSVGLTPKSFACLRRFERAVAEAASAPSLTAAALAAGYYDQSHFIRDFRRFAGVTPRAFLRAAP
jgi:AraC-like DNA-binding protein